MRCALIGTTSKAYMRLMPSPLTGEYEGYIDVYIKVDPEAE